MSLDKNPSMRTRYGIPRHLYTRPLTYGLERDLQNVDLHVDLSSQNAVRLKSNELDVALLSPIDYAQNSSQYRLVPNVCVSSRGGNRTVLLHFREGLRKINTIAADIGLTSELVLAKIIFAEKYDTNPQFIPMKPDIPLMIAKADAALLVGGPSLFHSLDNECTIDLVEQWEDLTDLPYVHALWISRLDALNPTSLYLLKHSLEEGVRHINEIARSAAEENHIEPEKCEAYLASFNFTLDEEAVDSLSEFYRYAFYYGLIGEVPELRFYATEEGSNIALN